MYIKVRLNRSTEQFTLQIITCPTLTSEAKSSKFDLKSSTLMIFTELNCAF